MKICPNLADPEVKALWQALVDDPQLGRMEAMREFIQAELQGRQIGTPAEVKAKLKKLYTPKSDVAEAARIREGEKAILDKVFDPVFADPDTAMGQAILATPINSKNLSIASNSNTRAMEIVRKLSDALGVKYAMVSPEEAIRITQNAKNPYNINKGPAFFYGDTVYFISGALTTEIALHEFAHPLIRSIQQQNPVLFGKLKEEALKADPSLLDEAIAEYEDLKQVIEQTSDEAEKAALKDNYKNLVAEEILVKALTKAAKLKVEGVEPSTAFGKLINNILYAIKQGLRKLFGKVNVAKMNANTTMDQLAEMLVEGKNFEINTETVSKEDVVAYFEAQTRYIKDMQRVADKAGNEKILGMIKLMYQGALQQVKMLRQSQNYKGIADLFVDEFGTGQLQQIKKDIGKYASLLENKAENLQQEVEDMGNEVKNLATSMMRLEVMMKNMSEHLAVLEKEKQTPDSVAKSQYYSHVLDYWTKYIAQVKDILTKTQGINTRSPILELVNSIETYNTRSSDSINKIAHEGMEEVLWDQWKDMSERAEELFSGQIKTLKEKGSSQRLIDARFTEYYGLTESQYNKYKSLKAKKDAGTILSPDDNKMYEQFHKETIGNKVIHMSKERVSSALKGEGADASWAKSNLMGYMYNSDPVIGGFATYYKNNMSEMQLRVQARYTEIVSDIEDAVKKAGVNRMNIGALGKKIGFVDNIGTYNPETGKLDKTQVWTLLNMYKDYRYDVDELNDKIKELEKTYNHTNSEEAKIALIAQITEKRKHLREWFHQEYVDAFYLKDEYFEKDDIGKAAAFERNKILDRIKALTDPLLSEDDIMGKAEEIDQHWKEYRLLHSLYDIKGDKKTGNDLEIALRLKEYKDFTRKFYEFKPREGAFQTALKNYEQEIYGTLKKLKFIPGEADFKNEFEARRQAWINRNTRIVIKPEFYQKRAVLLDRLKILLAKLPGNDANKLDFSKQWETILDAVSISRDDDGQPVGTEMNAGRKQIVKKAQQEMEAAKEKWAGFSGLTTDEMDSLIIFSERKKKGENLSGDDYKTYMELLERRNKLGLSKHQMAEVISIFADLKELQRKDPTEYYIDAINNQLESLDTEELFKKHGINQVDADSIDKLYDPAILEELFKQSENFEKWFNQNHISKKSFDKSTKTKLVKYERLYIWNVVKPNDPAHYETTNITREDGTPDTIPGLPSLKYYARVVKNVYRTGYDPATGKVKPVVGLHVDNRGEFLPKAIPGSKYINEEYMRLKNAPAGSQDAALFTLLQKITKHHIKNQEGLHRRSKLYLDFPRYEMSGLELLQTKSIKQLAEKKMSPLRLIIKRMKDFFVRAKDESGGGDINWKDTNMMVRADAFDDRIENIPIDGMYRLGIEETSTDIITSMFKYMHGAEEHKQLIKMNPMAKALKSILNDPDKKIKEMDQINESNFKNWGMTTYINKKGKYIRADAFNNFYERSFLGENLTGLGKDTPWVINAQKALFGKSSFAFFAFNIPSALKNAAGAKFQSMLESIAGNNITKASLIKGNGWSLKYMGELSSTAIYDKGVKSLDQQIGEIFDPSQGRFKDKFGESMSRSIAKDAVSTSWFYNFRKWTELQATMQTFGGMMYKEKVLLNGKEINYMDAWELNKEGKIQLKAGVDPKWGITYDVEGNMVVGQEFLNFKNRMHTVMNKLNGAYAQFDQPEMSRYLLFRQFYFLRKYFVDMFMNRYGTKNWNPGYGQVDQGYYIRAIKGIIDMIKYRDTAAMDTEAKKAFMKMATELGSLIILAFIIAAMGWDDDDEDRFAKLKDKSFIYLHSLSLIMQIRAENEQFIPLTGFGLDDLTSMIDLKSLAFGPTTDSYQRIFQDIMDFITGSEKQFYARDVGGYDWQKAGSRKIWNHLGKMYGLTGNTPNPEYAIINFKKAQNLSLVR
jgi:hypothetical protein